MTQTGFGQLVGIFLLLSCGSTASFARDVPSWPYDKLLAESDLAAIVEPLENRTATDPFPGFAYGHSTNDFEAINTRFKVQAVLKPAADASTELTVLHFSYSKRVDGVANGASFIQFLIGPLQYEKRALKDSKPVGGVTVFQQKPRWLAFLKRRADGRFEPVTGQYDSAWSFRELHESSFFAGP